MGKKQSDHLAHFISYIQYASFLSEHRCLTEFSNDRNKVSDAILEDEAEDEAEPKGTKTSKPSKP